MIEKEIIYIFSGDSGNPIHPKALQMLFASLGTCTPIFYLIWSIRWAMIPQPPIWKTGALPIELLMHIILYK